MLCVVIPTLNAETGLDRLLSQVSPYADRIIVSDGGSTDHTLSVATAKGAVCAVGQSGRGRQLKRGVTHSGECDWVLVLHADSQLMPGWIEAVEYHMSRHPQMAGYFDLKWDSRRLLARLSEGLVALRCRFWGLPYGDQGLLIRRDLYEVVGGYPAVSLFEDVMVIQALGKGRIRRLGVPILSDASKYERDGFVKRSLRNLRLLRRFIKGESPDVLSKAYQ